MISMQSSKSFSSTHSARLDVLHPSNCTLNSYKHPTPRCLAFFSNLLFMMDVTRCRCPLITVLPGLHGSSDESTTILSTILRNKNFPFEQESRYNQSVRATIAVKYEIWILAKVKKRLYRSIKVNCVVTLWLKLRVCLFVCLFVFFFPPFFSKKNSGCVATPTSECLPNSHTCYLTSCRLQVCESGRHTAALPVGACFPFYGGEFLSGRGSKWRWYSVHWSCVY